LLSLPARHTHDSIALGAFGGEKAGIVTGIVMLVVAVANFGVYFVYNDVFVASSSSRHRHSIQTRPEMERPLLPSIDDDRIVFPSGGSFESPRVHNEKFFDPDASHWQEHVDETSGRAYYYNATTGQTRFSPP
jgi:WW domain